MWVSYNFKPPSDYSSFCRSIYFWCHDATRKKNSIEKLNLNQNEQTNVNKLCPLSSPQKKKCGKFPLKSPFDEALTP